MAGNYDPSVDEDKRKSDDPRKLGSKRISTEEEDALLAAGFTRGQLYNRRGGLVERGLASLLEPGDVIEAIETGKVLIRTKEGVIQTFWNLTQPQPFLRPLTDEEKRELEPTGEAAGDGPESEDPSAS